MYLPPWRYTLTKLDFRVDATLLSLLLEPFFLVLFLSTAPYIRGLVSVLESKGCCMHVE